MALLLKVSIPAVSRFETGVNILRIDTLRLYAKHVHASLDEILQEIPADSKQPEPHIPQASLLRQARGLSIEEMAQLLKVHVRTISRFERGFNILRIDTLRLYAKHVNASVAEVVQGLPAKSKQQESSLQLTFVAAG